MTPAFWLGGELGSGGQLVWTSPDWAVLLAALVAVVAWLFTQVGARSWALRVADGLLLAGALTLVVVAVARPVWVAEEGRSERGRVVALVDASASMGVREAGRPRSDAVAEVLASLGPEVEVFHFGTSLVAGAPSSFQLAGTDVEAALAALSDRHAGEKLAGVVLLTDGLDRGPLRARWQREEEPLPPSVPGPLTVFQIGTTSEVHDLGIRAADAGGYAYVHAPFRIRAELQGVGWGSQPVEAELLKDGKVVATQSVSLDAEGQADVVFEVVPDRAGRFTYVVQVPDYEGDAVPGNNAWPLVVRVVRDRIRVLHVAGAPSWDVKFLRRFLKGDPSIDLVSFFILRTQQDLVRGWREDELSLIAFPYQELFAEDLHTFDLVIFQNFDHGPFFAGASQKLLGELAEYVRTDGHALVMIGGDRSFSLGEYGGTPLGEVLPVKVSATRVEPSLTPFLPRLTGAGERHPITRLAPDPVENAAWWSRLHDVDGTNLGIEVQPDATVLLEHPGISTVDGKPLPVLAVREVGAGRTMSLSVDTSWRWSLSEAALGKGNQAYLRFWKSALRWLVDDPATSRLTVETPRENYAVGDDVRVVVSVRSPSFTPLAGAQVTVKVRGPIEAGEQSAATTEDGQAVLTFRPEARGSYRAEAEVKEGDKVLGRTSTVFAVTNRDPELDEVAPDAAFLKWLAQRTEGTYYAPSERGPVLEDPAAARVVWDRSEVALWRSPLLGALVALMAGLSWVLRRRGGLR